MTKIIARKMQVIAVYGIILLFCVVNGDEPNCSKFDFEEKMLEKMVRMEFEMEIIKVEMQNNIKTVKDMNTQVENNLEVFSKKQEEINEQIGQLEVLKGKLSAGIKEVPRTPTVAFKARSNANINVKTGQTIVFPVVILNEGSGYDSTSGVFTAPVKGTYLFTTTFCVKSGNIITFSIMVDGTKQSTTLFQSDSSSGSHYADTNAVLNAGQKVWVQVIPGGNSGDIITHDDAYRWNMFSGTLVNV